MRRVDACRRPARRCADRVHIGAVELGGLPKIPGCNAAPAGAGVCRAESGETGAYGAVRVGSPRQERGKGRSAHSHSNRANGGESGAKSGREPLQVDRGGRRAGLDPHAAQAPPHGATQPAPGLGLAVEPFRSPAVAIIEPPILFAPSEPPPPGAQQRRMVGAGHHHLAFATPGKAVAPGRAPRAVLVPARKRRPSLYSRPGRSALPRGHSGMSCFAS